MLHFHPGKMMGLIRGAEIHRNLDSADREKEVKEPFGSLCASFGYFFPHGKKYPRRRHGHGNELAGSSARSAFRIPSVTLERATLALPRKGLDFSATGGASALSPVGGALGRHDLVVRW